MNSSNAQYTGLCEGHVVISSGTTTPDGQLLAYCPSIL